MGGRRRDNLHKVALNQEGILETSLFVICKQEAVPGGLSGRRPRLQNCSNRHYASHCYVNVCGRALEEKEGSDSIYCQGTHAVTPLVKAVALTLIKLPALQCRVTRFNKNINKIDIQVSSKTNFKK